VNGQHPVVGSWRVAVEVAGNQGPTNLATIAADGTMLVAFPSPTPAAPGASHRLEFWTPAVGSWVADGERGATMAFVALGVDENGTAIGTHTIAATATTDADGWHGPFTITVAGPDGRTLASVSGTVTATPIAATANLTP
jgi:hypothetical protein